MQQRSSKAKVNRHNWTKAKAMIKRLVKKDVKDVRVIRVRQLFVSRYPQERTANQVLAFFLWLQNHNPNLLPSEKQDNLYQGLKADLIGLYLRE